MMNRGSKWRGAAGGLMVACLMTASACATDADPDEELGGDEPIAEVRLADGGIVTFYEPEPGTLMIDQVVKIGAKPATATNRTAVELYQSLAPGEPVPPALLAAQARSDEARASRPHLDLPDAVVDAPVASISDSQFLSTYCIPSWWDIVQCNPLHKTYGVYYYQGNVDTVSYTTCTNSGVVTMRTQIGDGAKSSYDVFAGYCVQRNWTSGWLNETTRVWVTNVGGGDDYNLSKAYRW